ncbi:MAG TPA: anthranilate phosphoribosyltransferase [Rhodothermales bacterium]|nr:anthranilate phosphoribosyltransferase [Rhodothermales bacterium]
MREILHVIAEGEILSTEQAEQAMHLLMRGEAQPEEAAALLMGLRSRGEALPELIGFTRVMREYAVRVENPDPHAIDLCGTGGDSKGTFNISTAAAFVCAGAGVTVAKHGNRSVSSQCGSADVLEAAGVKVDLHKAGVEHCLREAGIAFLFAPYFHPAIRHVMPVRKKLGVRTFFNILGPLCNPAAVRRQLIGAFHPKIAQLMADILAELDAEHVITVHAEDGMDEISLCADTHAFEYQASQQKAGKPRRSIILDIQPSELALGCVTLDELRGGTTRENADILRRLLDGEALPHRDVVVVNAAYALLTSGKFDDIDACLDAARESLDSGRAKAKLANLVRISNEAPPDA